jgi:self-protective colicin-like immunity protein
MISAYLTGLLSVDAFEREFLRAFKAEPAGMDDELFHILDKLFGAVDAYWSECKPGEETAFRISEDSLRREAEEALERLNRYLRRNPISHSAS